jgi:hypothetical protein
MKILLAALMCLILCSSECFALKGGPVYPGGGTNIIGRYAGVLRPPFCPLPDPADCGGTLNSIGIFTLAVPQVGISDGAVLIFSEGRTFTGTLTALGNPNNGALTGVLNASYGTTDTFISNNGNTTTIFITHATASGGVNAKVSPSSNGQSFGVSSILVKGTANISIVDFDNGGATTGPFAFTVDGFKQSNTPL